MDQGSYDAVNCSQKLADDGWENGRILIAGLSLHVAAMVNSSSRIIRITVLEANVYYTSSGAQLIFLYLVLFLRGF